MDLEMKEYFSKMKDIHQCVINFLESTNESDECFEELVKYLDKCKIIENKSDFKQLLVMISKILKYYHFNQFNKKKIHKIICFYKEFITKMFSNNEIFDIFKNNKQILLFFFTNGIITIDKFIANIIINKYDEKYPQFFYPEIKSYISEEEMNEIKSEISNDEDLFDQKRQIGENDSYICSLIRQDSVQEFIAYVNRFNVNLSSKIKQSIFETNSYLIKKEPTLIEYAAYFGSIQIIRYLFYGNVDLTESVWAYAVHSKSPMLIHFLEENINVPKDKFFKCCIIEAIKCHHNEIVEYMENNLNGFNIYDDELIFEYMIRYHNFNNFVDDLIDNFIDHFPFYTLAKYRYYSFINHYLEIKKDMIETKIISKRYF